MFVEDFRGLEMTGDEVIQEAINEAAPGATINFEPNRVYLIENRILVKQFQCLNGNNVTLRHANQTFTTLKTPALSTSNKLEVQLVPRWKRGDQLEVVSPTMCL